MQHCAKDEVAKQIAKHQERDQPTTHVHSEERDQWWLHQIIQLLDLLRLITDQTSQHHVEEWRGGKQQPNAHLKLVVNLVALNESSKEAAIIRIHFTDSVLI